MKNILVPVDFSEPSKHAAHYALALAQQLHAEKIILYNAYQQPLPSDPLITEPTMNVMEVYNITDLSDISREHLQRFKNEIADEVSGNITVEVIGEFNDLVEGIREVCTSHYVDLVVTGITVGDRLTETLAGSRAIEIAKQITTPVMIVPPDADYKMIQNVLFACDYKQVAETTPTQPIEKILAETGAQLHVLHVNETSKENTEITKESATLRNLLQHVSPGFHVVQHNNFAEAINLFTEQNNIDLVVAIPKKHGFFEGLFHKSHIKMLAFHTHTPLHWDILWDVPALN